MSAAPMVITCDGCGEDITRSGNSIDWRLGLRNESMPSVGGAVTDMMICPAFDTDKHFCRRWCLEEWMHGELEERRRTAAAEAAKIALAIDGIYGDVSLTLERPHGRVNATVHQWRKIQDGLEETARRYL